MDSHKNNNNETVVLKKDKPASDDGTIVQPQKSAPSDSSTIVQSGASKAAPKPYAAEAPTLATAKREQALTQLHDKLKDSHQNTQGFSLSLIHI